MWGVLCCIVFWVRVALFGFAFSSVSDLSGAASRSSFVWPVPHSSSTHNARVRGLVVVPSMGVTLLLSCSGPFLYSGRLPFIYSITARWSYSWQAVLAPSSPGLVCAGCNI